MIKEKMTSLQFFEQRAKAARLSCDVLMSVNFNWDNYKHLI